MRENVGESVASWQTTSLSRNNKNTTNMDRHFDVDATDALALPPVVDHKSRNIHKEHLSQIDHVKFLSSPSKWIVDNIG